MKLLSVISLVLVLFLSAETSAQTISTDSVKNYINKEVTVKGVITQVGTPKSGVVYFNMDGRYPDNKFAAVIMKKDVEKFGDVKSWEGKTVEISGTVQDYKGNPEIILKSPEQLKVVK